MTAERRHGVLADPALVLVDVVLAADEVTELIVNVGGPRALEPAHYDRASACPLLLETAQQHLVLIDELAEALGRDRYLATSWELVTHRRHFHR